MTTTDAQGLTAQHLTAQKDWLRTMSWDVTDHTGAPVDSLDGLAHVLGVNRDEAAAHLLANPAGKAPPQLLD